MCSSEQSGVSVCLGLGPAPWDGPYVSAASEIAAVRFGVLSTSLERGVAVRSMHVCSGNAMT